MERNRRDGGMLGSVAELFDLPEMYAFQAWVSEPAQAGNGGRTAALSGTAYWTAVLQ